MSFDPFDEIAAREALSRPPAGRRFTSQEERRIRHDVLQQLNAFLRDPQSQAQLAGGVVIDPSARDLRPDEIGWQYDCLPPAIEFGVITCAA